MNLSPLARPLLLLTLDDDETTYGRSKDEQDDCCQRECEQSFALTRMPRGDGQR